MSRPCSLASNSGVTLLEVLLALAIVAFVASAALSLTLSGRGLYEVDQARARLNQCMRIALDQIVTDVRQAGEQLGADFPALGIVDGTSGAPDQLLVRRNLEPTVLRVCQDIASGGTDVEVYIAETGGPPPPGCAPVADDDADGWPENLEAWRDFRNGQTLRAYLFNPATGDGEFFDYIDEDADDYYLEADTGTTWQHDYPVSDEPRVYLLEEKRFELSDDVLQVVVNDDTAGALRLADGFQQFQLVARFQDGSEQDTLGFADVWSDLRAIEISLAGEAAAPNGRTIERAWSSAITPRNVLSR